jgi:hypothetical protein
MKKINFKIPKVEMFGIDIIKNALLFSLFFIVFLLFLVVLLVPTIKKFKTIKTDYYQTKIETDKYERKMEKLAEEYKKIYTKNRKIILSLNREFDKEAFKNFSAKFMKINNITENNQTKYKQYFIKKTFVVSSTIDTPINFYKFVDEIKNYKNVLKIYFPVVFKAKNGEIKLIFKMEYFKVDNKLSPLSNPK